MSLNVTATITRDCHGKTQKLSFIEAVRMILDAICLGKTLTTAPDFVLVVDDAARYRAAEGGPEALRQRRTLQALVRLLNCSNDAQAETYVEDLLGRDCAPSELREIARHFCATVRGISGRDANFRAMVLALMAGKTLSAAEVRDYGAEAVIIAAEDYLQASYDSERMPTFYGLLAHTKSLLAN